jgi:pyruvate dehydrogenase kinase 2/3/4
MVPISRNSSARGMAANVRRSLGTLFRASQFLSEELPIRLAHRVQELGDLPDGLNEMPSIKKVQDWYAQSFEVIHTAPRLSNRDAAVDM